MIKKLIAAGVMVSAIAIAPVVAQAETMDHHEHHHHMRHHHHHVMRHHHHHMMMHHHHMMKRHEGEHKEMPK